MSSNNKIHFLRPDREKIDVSEVLELLENGNISDLEGGESEEENEVNGFSNLFSGKCTICDHLGFSFVYYLFYIKSFLVISCSRYLGLLKTRHIFFYPS